jgi:hypothetical protein
MENLIVEKNEGVERLVLGGGGDVLLDRQIGKKRLDFESAHFPRVSFLVEKDVTFNPMNVNFLGTQRVMLDAKDLSDLVEKFGFWVGNDTGGTADVFAVRRSAPLVAEGITKWLMGKTHAFRIDESNSLTLYVKYEREYLLN